MGNAILSFLTGAAGAAFVAGIFSLIMNRLSRKDSIKDQQAKQAGVEQKALRYIMLFIIQERAKSHIKDAKITLEERRSLHHWHSLYHDGLGGNGDADALMTAVDELPVDYGE